MLYGAILHLIAGAIAGAVFRIGVLIALVFVVFLEAVVVLVAHGAEAALWAFGYIALLQVGYFAASLARSSLSGMHPLPTVKTRRAR